METRDAILKRKSVRRFVPDRTVDDATIKSILELGIRAPSAGNLQPWKIFVVKNPRTRSMLGEMAYADFVSAAPVVFVICIDGTRSRSGYGRRGAELYCIQDTAALIENILLGAVDRGLGTCWIGAFNEEQCKKILSIPDDLRPVAIVPLGYPADDSPRTGRRALKEVTVWD